MESRRAVAWSTGFEGVAAFLAAVVSGWYLMALFWSAIIRPGFSEPGGALLDRAPVTLVLAAVAVVVAPVLARPFGRSGAWLVAALGLSSSAAVDSTLATIDPVVVDGTSVVAVGSGLVLGSLVSMVPTGPSGRTVARVLALAIGLPAAPTVVRFVASVTGSSRWFFIAALLSAAAMAAVSHERGRAKAASEASDHPAAPAPLSAVLAPTLVVAGAAVAVLVADVVRQAVIDEIALSVGGSSTPRRQQAVITFDWMARSATAVALGLLLVGFGYHRGRGHVGRWVATGVGLAALVSPALQSVSAGPAGPWLFIVAVTVVAGCGLALTKAADRGAPWDAVGLMLAAIGLLLGLQQVEAEFATVQSLRLSAYLVATGCALALGAGLGRLAPCPDERRSIEAATGDAALGLATAVLTASVVAPLWAPMVFAQPPGTDPQWQPSALVIAASLVVILFFGLTRAVDRVRRDIQAEAAGEPPLI